MPLTFDGAQIGLMSLQLWDSRPVGTAVDLTSIPMIHRSLRSTGLVSVGCFPAACADFCFHWLEGLGRHRSELAYHHLRKSCGTP
jgi:hypothetical protein